MALLRRTLKWLGVLVLALLGVVLIDAWQGLGHRATGARRARMEKSPQWRDGAFENPEPIVNFLGPMLTGMAHTSPDAAPRTPVPVEQVDPQRFLTAPPSGLRVTWLGHSTVLLELDGHRVLTDPVWSDRASPLAWVGPHRWYPPLFPLEQVPRLDAVLISHDHYDHLDQRTVVALAPHTARFIVPLGVGAHLEYWGIAPEQIVEVDWWDRVQVGALEIVATPVRHASGRALHDKDATLWASYALLGPSHRAWFSGDTGLFTALEDIGEKLGPFDVTLIEVGQYHRAWPDWHLGPEQAVTAHRAVRGKVFFPIHWGLFTLAYHGWTEPIERGVLAARTAELEVVAPRPGQSVEPGVPPELVRWWPTLPFETAEQHAVVSGNVHFRSGGLSGAAPAK